MRPVPSYPAEREHWAGGKPPAVDEACEVGQRFRGGLRCAWLGLYLISIRRGYAVALAPPWTVIVSGPFSKSALVSLSSMLTGKVTPRLKAP